jgi:hypothetical protein
MINILELKLVSFREEAVNNGNPASVCDSEYDECTNYASALETVEYIYLKSTYRQEMLPIAIGVI